jgi:hypothetical protein
MRWLEGREGGAGTGAGADPGTGEDPLLTGERLPCEELVGVVAAAGAKALPSAFFLGEANALVEARTPPPPPPLILAPPPPLLLLLLLPLPPASCWQLSL